MTRRRFAVALALPCVAAAIVYLFCPKPSLYGDTPFSTAVEDRNGRLLRLGLASDERYRLPTKLEDIADTAIDATLLYEDRWFRRHPGVNPWAVLRAAWTTYVQRDKVVGASTITMQLARLRFSLPTRTVRGKLTQIVRALQLERHYSKDEILEAYLNLAPYGGNIEGIGTAARIYFDKPAARLSLPESLALAVIAQNPAGRNPATASGYREMAAARARLAEAWAEVYGLNDTRRAQLQLPLAVRAPSELPFAAPHVTSELLAGADGGTLRSTIDYATQQMLEQRIGDYLARRRSTGLHNASALLLDHRDMGIVASVGSASFFDARIEGQVDGTRSKRSPGSTLKPFVYGLALDQGLIHPMTLMKDSPRRYAAYTPENFDRGFMGPVFAQDALIYSRNVPAIDLLSRVGYERFHQLLVDADVAALREPEHYGLAMILGGNELTMRELAALYAMLANGGRAAELRLDASAATETGKQLLSAESAYLVLDMLGRNPRPDPALLAGSRRTLPVAWKTGTSYAYRDAWSVGVFGPYVLAVWVGNFDGTSNPAFVGQRAAAPLFFEIVDALSRELDSSDAADTGWAADLHALNLRQVDVCASTGDLPGRYCPGVTQTWFIPGVSPIRVSDVHRPVRIDVETGLRSCRFDPQTTREEVFEFWPSDISRLFRQAGMALRRPPAWSPECSQAELASSGAAPEITSPAAALTYLVRADRDGDESLALTATTDADARWLYWFADDRFLARVDRDQPFLWQPSAGRYDLLAVDDLGRAASRRLTILAAQ